MHEFDVKLTKDDIGLFMSGVVSTRRLAIVERRRARDLKSQDYYGAQLLRIDTLLRKLETAMNHAPQPDPTVLLLD